MKKNSKTPCMPERGLQGAFQSRNSLVHPTAVIGPNVTIAANVTVGPYSVIQGSVAIGEGSRIDSHVSIGAAAQVIGCNEPRGTVRIGKNCTIREFASIHSCKYDDGQTLIGDECYIMSYVHVAHDVILEQGVTLTNRSSLGGHVIIGKKAVVMANAALHQRCRVGAYSAISPFSGSRQDLPPFCLFQGQPGKFAGLNTYALKNAGLTAENRAALKHVTHLFFQRKEVLLSIMQQAKNEPSWGADPYVQEFLTFIHESERGVSRKTILNS